jgi:acyl carrier protein
MNQDEIVVLIRKYFKEQFEIPEENVVLDAHLFQDLELDSIDALDMVGMLETELDIEVHEEDLKSIRTVHDVVNYVSSQVA